MSAYSSHYFVEKTYLITVVNMAARCAMVLAIRVIRIVSDSLNTDKPTKKTAVRVATVSRKIIPSNPQATARRKKIFSAASWSAHLLLILDTNWPQVFGVNGSDHCAILIARRVLVLFSGNNSAMGPSHAGIRRVIVHRVRKDDARGCPYLTRRDTRFFSPHTLVIRKTIGC